MAAATILLVEDDQLMAELYEEILVASGFCVKCAESGEHIHELACSDRPDLVIMDVMMPHVNGIEALRLLKRDVITDAIPVLMFSNVLDAELASQAVELGAVRYAVKTDYKPEAFVTMVRQLLDESRLAQASF